MFSDSICLIVDRKYDPVLLRPFLNDVSVDVIGNMEDFPESLIFNLLNEIIIYNTCYFEYSAMVIHERSEMSHLNLIFDSEVLHFAYSFSHDFNVFHDFIFGHFPH
jgi:hypothetical protein